MNEVKCWKIRTSWHNPKSSTVHWITMGVNFAFKKDAEEIAKQLRWMPKADERKLYVEVYKDKCFKENKSKRVVDDFIKDSLEGKGM